MLFIVNSLIEELEKIVNLSDLEMRDGDTARNIAKKAIASAKVELELEKCHMQDIVDRA